MKQLSILMACLFMSILQIANAQTPPLYPWKTLGFDSTYLPGQLHLKGNLKLPNGTLVVGADTIAPSAAFEVNSNSKGVLIPRLSPPMIFSIPNPKQGLLVYNTATNQFNYFDGSFWIPINAGSSVTPSGPGNRIAYFNSATGFLSTDSFFIRDSSNNYHTLMRASSADTLFSQIEMDSSMLLMGNVTGSQAVALMLSNAYCGIGYIDNGAVEIRKDSLTFTFRNAQSFLDSALVVNKWGGVRKAPLSSSFASGLSGDVQINGGGALFGTVSGFNINSAMPGFPVLNVHAPITNGGGIKIGSQGITFVDPNGYNISMVPPSLSTSDVWTLPNTPGADKQVLTYTTAGNLAWKYLEDVDTSIAQLKFVKITLDSAQLQNCFSSPVQLLAAPGLGKAIEPITITHRYRHLSAAYSVSGSVNILEGSSMVYSNIDLTTASTSIKHKALVSDFNLTVNTGLFLSATSSNPAFGNGELDIYITYKIIDL